MLSLVLVFRPPDNGAAMVAWCYASTDMVDWRNMTFLWQAGVSCYQHISSCNYSRLMLGGRNIIHCLAGRWEVWAGAAPVTDYKLTEIFRPTVACWWWWWWWWCVARIPGRNYLHILATVKSSLASTHLPTSLIKIGHGLPCSISARSQPAPPANRQDWLGWLSLSEWGRNNNRIVNSVRANCWTFSSGEERREVPLLFNFWGDKTHTFIQKYFRTNRAGARWKFMLPVCSRWQMAAMFWCNNKTGDDDGTIIKQVMSISPPPPSSCLAHQLNYRTIDS